MFTFVNAATCTKHTKRITLRLNWLICVRPDIDSRGMI